VVDVGVTFGDLTTPGVDIITPDASFLQEHAADILGIIVTHAHEDHIGGLPWLWPLLKAPIYTTPFTAFLVREKLHNAGVQGFKIHEVPLGGRIDLGPFQIDLITLTHSIPEPNGLAIRTPHGIVLHTGDWKIDPDPSWAPRPTSRPCAARRRGRAGHGLRLAPMSSWRASRAPRPTCAMR
jgi:ribonuclease J